MKLEKNKIYEIFNPKCKWVVYVEILDIYETIEGKMIKMKRLLIKGDIEFPLKYEILEKHIGYGIKMRECKQSDIVLELLDDE